MKMLKSPIKSLNKPFLLDIGEHTHRFVDIGNSTNGKSHVAYLHKSLLDNRVQIHPDLIKKLSPHCTMFYITEQGGTFAGYLFSTNSKLTYVNNYYLSVGEPSEQPIEQSTLIDKHEELFIYTSDHIVLAISSEVKDRFLIEDKRN